MTEDVPYRMKCVRGGNAGGGADVQPGVGGVTRPGVGQPQVHRACEEEEETAREAKKHALGCEMAAPLRAVRSFCHGNGSVYQ